MVLKNELPEKKAALRATTEELVSQFLEKGGKPIVDRAYQSGNGYSARDWSRAERGLKVATGEEIGAERDRRALIAIANKDLDLLEKLLTFGFDAEIKFDIENDRLGPNGEIR